MSDISLEPLADVPGVPERVPRVLECHARGCLFGPQVFFDLVAEN